MLITVQVGQTTVYDVIVIIPLMRVAKHMQVNIEKMTCHVRLDNITIHIIHEWYRIIYF